MVVLVVVVEPVIVALMFLAVLDLLVKVIMVVMDIMQEVLVEVVVEVVPVLREPTEVRLVQDLEETVAHRQ
jgi:hypothetical protein